MRWPVVVVIALSGCHAILGIDDFQTAQPGDGGIDSNVPADVPTDFPIDVPSDSLTCYGTLKTICFTAEPNGQLTLSGTLNTTNDMRCASYPQSGGPDLCVISAKDITVQALTVSGSRPLVLVGVSSVKVFGFLDGSSRHGVIVGPAANTAGCTTNAGAQQSIGGGGGGGGGLGSTGGQGGRGGNGGQGGIAGATITITRIRGGCPGGRGGDGEQGTGGIAGDGGGAIAILAGNTIQIGSAGGVFASGAGGGGGNINTGKNRGAGGGGGSGGLIVLEAPSIDLQGTVTTNGAGGGGGGDSGDGHDGEDGRQQSYSTVAAGGMREGANHGGDGGAGSYLVLSAVDGMIAGQGGGGGGGGGVGVIWVKGSVTGGAKVSPPIEQH